MLDSLLLLLLSAVWGASFLFLRLAAPAFGPFSLILMRLSFAGVALLPFFLSARARRVLWQNRWLLVIAGFISSALPFTLLAYASLSLEAGLASLLNATTPIFTVLVAAVWLGTRITPRQASGLLVAMGGVALLSLDKLSFQAGGSGWAVVAALVASLCYGIGANYTREKLAHVSPTLLAGGSLLFAALLQLPAGTLAWPEVSPAPGMWAAVIALALVCTAAPTIIYYRLIQRTGPLAATSVTFLIPVFAVLWGRLFLAEPITARLLAGMALTLMGTALALGVLPRWLSRQVELRKGQGTA